MFNNRFNTKNDPLVEAVKQAQRDGDMRRAAEAYVNEQFGVYSRKAVIRENLAAYDAALEEAYKCMKEDTPENIMNPKSQWAQKQAADKNNPFNQPTPNPTDVAPNIMIRGNTQGGTSSMVDKVKSLFKEGKPLDPVGQEDSDIDNDRRHNTKTDKYLLHRRAVRSKAIAMKEADMRVGDPLADEPLKKAGNPPLMSVADPKGLKTAFTAVRQSKGMPIDDLKEGSMYDGKNPFDSKDGSVQRGSSEVSDSKATSYDKTLPKEYPGAASSAPTADRLRNAGGLKENQLDEISRDMKSRYIEKAMEKASEHRAKGYTKGWKPKKGAKAEHEREMMNKRTAGISRAGKNMEEEALDEISMDLARRYYKKAGEEGAQLSSMHGGVGKGELTKYIEKKMERRHKGREAALRRRDGKVPTSEESQLDEVSRKTLVSYIRKAVKSKATPENISKRTKGMEMAAKRMEEGYHQIDIDDSSFNAAQETGKSVSEAAYFRGTKGGYTIRKGETLSGIARAQGVKISDIMRANPSLRDPNKIAAGGRLVVPGAKAQPSHAPAAGTAKPTPPAATARPAPSGKPSPLPPGQGDPNFPGRMIPPSEMDLSKPAPSSSKPAMAGGQTAMKLPTALAGRDQEKDVATAATGPRGIRSWQPSTGQVTPGLPGTPGATSPQGRATSLPTAPASVPSEPKVSAPKPETSSSTPPDQEKQTGTVTPPPNGGKYTNRVPQPDSTSSDMTPAKPTSSDMFDTTPTAKKKLQESVVVGSNKYRII